MRPDRYASGISQLAEREAGGAELWMAEPEYTAMDGFLHQSKLDGRAGIHRHGWLSAPI
ncbi:hypothetical protein [Pseudoalteromonas sp. PPB1]|uniref:hypothetical protein n=1 Tax=Pseudoalteromonas sp. PPB1 TaxID=2756136 RepID=UPI001891E0F2|nr:hypothetical protein [Pseudoalteromonas sp. PPB1]